MNQPKYLDDQIDFLVSEGNDRLDEEDIEGAIAKWTQALTLLPEPKADWEAFIWLSTSLGDAHYRRKRYGLARHHFLDALNAPGGIDNLFIHYRLGQCQLKLGERAKAMEELLKAYMLDGEDIFTMEDDGMTWLQRLRDGRLVD